MRRRTLLAELTLFVLTIAWGYSFVAIPWGLAGCGVMALTALRMGVGLAFLAALRPRMGMPTATEWRAGTVGGLLLAGGYVLQTAGLLEAGSGRSGFLTAFYVALVPLFEGLIFRRLPPGRDLAALAIATAGITVMVVRTGLDVSPAEVLVAASALCWAAQIVVVGRAARDCDPLRLAAIQLLVLTLVAGAGALAAPGPPVRWSWRFVAIVLYLGVVTNAIAFLGQAWAQRHVPPTRAAIIYAPEPVFAAIFGVWLAGEAFGPRDWAGSALVMAAVALTLLPRTKDAPAAQGGG